MKDFTNVAQQVWAASTIDAKRDLLLQVVEDFDHKGKFGEKAEKFRRAVNRSSKTQLDFMASNLALNADLKVIK